MRQRDAGSIKAICFNISIKTSLGTSAMGHGGGGSPSMIGSAGGIDRLANVCISSGVGSISGSSVFSFVVSDDWVAGAEAGAGAGAQFAEKCFLRYF